MRNVYWVWLSIFTSSVVWADVGGTQMESAGPPRPTEIRFRSEPAWPAAPIISADGSTGELRAALHESHLVVAQLLDGAELRNGSASIRLMHDLAEAIGPESDVKLISLVVDAPGAAAHQPAALVNDPSVPQWGLARLDPAAGAVLRPVFALGAVWLGNNRTGQWLRLDQPDLPSLREALDQVGQVASRRWFTDLVLTDQANQPQRFYSDVLEGKIVVVDFIFTHCQGICPMLSATLRGLQQRLGPLVGDSVRLVSISIDPERDTPAALTEFASRFQAGPGWMFLTGDKQKIDWVSYKLGAYNEKVEEHFAAFLVGDAVSGQWSKVVASAPLDDLEQLVRSLVTAREKERG